MTLQPLNGTKTHPLSDHAIDILRWINRLERPRQEVNAGVVNRLEREDLVKVIRLPSPYKTKVGTLIDFLQITEAGRNVLRDKGDKI